MIINIAMQPSTKQSNPQKEKLIIVIRARTM